MMQKPTYVEQSTGTYLTALWIWTVLASALSGIAFGHAFRDGGTFSGWWVVWGAIAGALSTLPFWALYGLGRRILRNLIRLRTDLAGVLPPAAQ